MKLHIGAGKRYLEGYKHIDIIDLPHIDYVADVRNLAFLENESVEEIYACHVLEHFGRNEGLNVLKEWNRVLIGGGGNSPFCAKFSSNNRRVSTKQ